MKLHPIWHLSLQSIEFGNDIKNEVQSILSLDNSIIKTSFWTSKQYIQRWINLGLLKWRSMQIQNAFPPVLMWECFNVVYSLILIVTIMCNRVNSYIQSPWRTSSIRRISKNDFWEEKNSSFIKLYCATGDIMYKYVHMSSEETLPDGS